MKKKKRKDKKDSPPPFNGIRHSANFATCVFCINLLHGCSHAFHLLCFFVYTQTTFFSVQWPLGAPCNALLKARGRPSPQTYTLFNLLSNNDNSKTAWLFFFFYLSLSSGETVSSQGGVVVCSSVSTGPGDSSRNLRIKIFTATVWTVAASVNNHCQQKGWGCFLLSDSCPQTHPSSPQSANKHYWSTRACRHSPPILVFGGLKDTLERPTVHLHKLEACVGAGEHAKKKNRWEEIIVGIIVLEKLIDRQSGTEEMQVQVVLLREVGVIHWCSPFRGSEPCSFRSVGFYTVKPLFVSTVALGNRPWRPRREAEI